MSNSTFDRMLQVESGGRQKDSSGRTVRSSKGAVGIAQVMPATGPEAARDAGLPWDPVRFENDAEYNAALGKAYHAKLLRMFDGDERKAIAAYNAGPGRVQSAIARRGDAWEADLPGETVDYLRKVTGTSPKYSTAVGNTSVSAVDLRDIPIEDLLSMRPDDLFGDARRPLPKDRTPKTPSVRDRVISGLTGGDGIGIAPVTDQGTYLTEQQDQVAAEMDFAEAESFSGWDKFVAGMEETLTLKIIDALGEESREFDPAFMETYRNNWQEIESFAQTDAEVAQLREATSEQHLAAIKEDIEDDREREKIINSAASPTLLRLGTGVLDPVGWAAGAGVGKAAQLAGVGARALIMSGRPVAGIAAAAGEGAVGNLAVTAGLDISGDYVSAGEYGMSALTGLAIGAALGGISTVTSRGAVAEARVEEARAAREAYFSDVRAEVTEANPNATPEQITEAVNKRVTEDYMKVLDFALADIPEHQRLMVAEEILVENGAFKQAVIDANDLESIADMTERAMVAETVARAEKIVAANPVNKEALNTFLARVGHEATSTRLLTSDNAVAKAVAITLLENPQGAAGRHRSAAITSAIRERVYNEQLSGYDDIAHTWRRQQGVSAIRDAWDGKARNAFNRRVFREIERRQGKPAGTHFDSDPLVVQAADKFEAGMEKMRIEQQRVGTVGAARLGDNSVGYVPHRLDPRKLLGLSAGQRKRVRAILAGQFQELEGMDAKFADKLAAKYLERGIDAANGRYQVPFNLHSPEAGEMVRDALEAMNLDPADLEKIMGKFSRGGASHTKRRLRLDLEEDIGDGMQLMDIFVTDIPNLYRSYARRVAGEVSLAQHGVMGKKGLAILAKAMEATGATPQEIKAFDQIAAEFLNTPFGSRNHPWMDDLRMATSAARLGGMAFTQFAEFGNAILPLGVNAAARGVGSMARHIQGVRAIAKGTAKEPDPILGSLDMMGGGVGMDDYYLTRLFDVKDNDIEMYNGSEMGVFSRAARAGAQMNMVLSGHRMLLAAQTRSMSEEILRKAVRVAKAGDADTALEDMGINQALRDAIRKDIDRIAEFDAQGRVTKLDLFQGEALTPAMVNELAQAVERGAGQIIQRTFKGETGYWAHDGFLKLLYQFRTFSITAVEKQWGRNLRNYGALKSFAYLMAAASFALPIHMARMQAKMLAMPEDKREDYWEKNSNPLALARATLNYASAAGLSGDIMDVGATMFSNYGGDLGESFGDSYGIRGKNSSQLVGGVIAPGAGMANDLYQGLTGDPHKIMRSLPGSNLPYVTPFVTAAEELASEVAGE